MPRETPPLAQPPLPDQGGDETPPPQTVDLVALPTRPTLPPVEFIPTLEPSAPRPPVEPLWATAPAPAPAWDLSSQRTEQWGDPPHQRLVFVHYAEQHTVEAQRLRQRLAELEETLPQRAGALAVLEVRCELLQRARATLGPHERQELARLLQHLPEGLAKLQAERAEQARLLLRVAYHEQVAQRWRERAALER